jgi:hypothetical protein
MTRIEDLEPYLGPGSGEQGVDWVTVERGLRIALPGDYRQFIDLYGSGSISGFLFILHLTTPTGFLNLQHQVSVRLDALRILRDSGTEQVPTSPSLSSVDCCPGDSLTTATWPTGI